MKEERIVRRTLADSHLDKTDWARLRAMTEEEIDRNALDDPDNPPWTDEELAAAVLVSPSMEPRVPVSIRLHPEVVRFFKKQGPGYQSRINAVLLGYVRAQKKSSTKENR
jgi:uncharacterized protein (DUF4415 family)